MGWGGVTGASRGGDAGGSSGGVRKAESRGVGGRMRRTISSTRGVVCVGRVGGVKVRTEAEDTEFSDN